MRGRVLSLFLLAPALLANGGNAARGRLAFRDCAACHTGAPGALAPDLKGIVGKPAGAEPGYRYSGPLKRSNTVWTRERLIAFIQNPQKAIPGNRMPFSGVADPAAAEDIVAFLAQNK